MMGIDRVKDFFSEFGLEDRVLELTLSSATAPLAARALNCETARIAKTLSFMLADTPLLIVCAGDMKIDNKKYKSRFGKKAKMMKADEVLNYTGFQIGGVCPFALSKDIPIYLDISLKRFETVFPACGSSNSVIELNLTELENYSGYLEWVDVCSSLA